MQPVYIHIFKCYTTKILNIFFTYFTLFISI